MNNYGTSFVESEIMLAATALDYVTVAERLSKMTDHELYALDKSCSMIKDLIVEQQERRNV